MLRTYEAIYKSGIFRWVDQMPPLQEMRVVVVADVVEAKADNKIDEILDRAWGCLGTGKSLDEIDIEINEMRKEWDREWD